MMRLSRPFLACALVAALDGPCVFGLSTSSDILGPLSDWVSRLPGYGEPPTPQFSGFLDASAAEAGTYLHYWFATAESPDAINLPVVLWLNGGPGSSSIVGMLQEIGPLLINATGGLFRNPYAWTRHANLLVLESPAGVGWSYCAAMTRGQACSNSDISTAKAARAALQDFYDRKFSKLLKNGLYIVGESYAGVYVPTLAAEVLAHCLGIKLLGIAVGDPCTDNTAQRQAMDMLWYGHKYGFVTDADFHFLRHNCSFRSPSFLSWGRWERVQGDWTSPGPGPGPTLDTRLHEPSRSLCLAALRRFWTSSSRAFSQPWKEGFINNLSLYGPAAPLRFDIKGSLNYMTAQWMQNAAVRQVLHVADCPSHEWPGPWSGWAYESQYDACNAFVSSTGEGKPESMIDFYRRLAPAIRRTIVYNGNTDPCLSYEGTQLAIKRVGFEELDGGQLRPWFYHHGAASHDTLSQKPLLFGPNLNLLDAGPQFGGLVVNYAHNLTFLTVHGAGHMVPQFRPQAAERILQNLLSGEPFSPPFLANRALGNISDDEFDNALDEWVEGAKKGTISVDPVEPVVLTL